VAKPSIVHAQTWRPPKAPPRAKLRRGPTDFSLSLIELPGNGPEDVAIGADGQLYAGLVDGRIVRIHPDSGRTDVVADTGGRPLGVEVDPDGGLVVCDPFRGVLHVDPATGKVTTMTDKVDGITMLLCDNSSLTADGTVYFSDSSTQFGLDHYKGELLAHSGTGRLLRRTPDGAVDLVADGLQFANGVALAADESWVAVAQTAAYCIDRVWLSGPRQGQRETLVDNLPAFPDNVSLGSDGLIWVALPSPRDSVLDLLLPRPAAVRRLVWALPDAVQPKPKSTVWVQAYDVTGRLVHDLQCEHPRFRTVTGVRELDGVVWLGSLTSAAIGRIDLRT
jgi:sugar lactone lactonase YvrE